MPSLLDSLGNIVSGIFGSIIAVFQGIFNTVLGIFSTLLAAAGTTISGLAQTFDGLLKFLLSNIVVIGGMIAAFFLYTVYQQRNGRSLAQAPSGSKKIN